MLRLKRQVCLEEDTGFLWKGKQWQKKTKNEGQHHTHMHVCTHVHRDSHVDKYIRISPYVHSCIYTHKNLPKSTKIYETLHINRPTFLYRFLMLYMEKKSKLSQRNKGMFI